MDKPIHPTPRPEIAATPGAHHGALDYEELERLGLHPDEVLDFSVNSNPYGPSPTVAPAIAGAPLDQYPDREALALRRVLSERLSVPVDHIVAGNGTAELLMLAAWAFLRAGDRVLIVGPTFGEYARSARLAGAEVCEWTARARDSFKPDPAAIVRMVHEVAPRVVVVCNPNNPTGALIDAGTIGDWARARPSTLFVVDEAYLAFAADARPAPGLGNVLALRSMTKDHALAGLRLGYAVGEPRVIQALAAVRPAWNVSALAQAAGIASLGDTQHLRETLAALGRAKTELVGDLERLGLAVLPSATHFFLVEVGDGAAFRARLLRHGIQVRDCASFGIPSYVRIATRRPEENGRLVEVVGRMAHGLEGGARREA